MLDRDIMKYKKRDSEWFNREYIKKNENIVNYRKLIYWLLNIFMIDENYIKFANCNL